MSRIRGESNFQCSRTKAHIMREYNVDKWGRLLADYEEHPERLKRFVMYGDDEALLAVKDTILEGPSFALRAIRMAYMEKIFDVFAPGTVRCELGAGFGQNFIGMPGEFYGGEYTQSGLIYPSLHIGFLCHCVRCG